mmetsp:Transcript_21106/g.18715  ORF Transcript_21106/g.18715 Transcript_21106/m.18715 type:complete len:95 (+) Transcript_21106:60-344(+)
MNPNFSTKVHGGTYDSQIPIMGEDYQSSYNPYEGYNGADSSHSDQNIAAKSSPQGMDMRFSKSFNRNEYDEVETDIRNVENIQKELHQMDISHK